MSLIVKAGKLAKRTLKKVLPEAAPTLNYTRRIEAVATTKRICAMTFDDGPCNLPASPDRFDGRSLTDVLLDALGQYGAKGTFDVVGDTSENYPDEAGKVGTAAWGGIRYDHYPDFGKDEKGGALHNERLISRMLSEGHQITNHGYRHIIFGRKPFVYGRRVSLKGLDAVVEDLTRLDTLLRQRHGYQLTMARPPHYVDRLSDGFSSYDVYALMGYQYLGAAFDGAGWLPSVLPDPESALQAEIRAMVEPMEKALAENPDCFCGKIIFQKDGCNMAKRTPVAWALPQQLELLTRYGYRVVTVSELMEESPFRDLGRDDPDFSQLELLARQRAIVYSDNCLRPEKIMTCGELAMLLSPRDETLKRRMVEIRRTGKAVDPCFGAMSYCIEKGLLPAGTATGAPVSALPEGIFRPCGSFTRRAVYAACIPGQLPGWNGTTE